MLASGGSSGKAACKQRKGKLSDEDDKEMDEPRHKHVQQQFVLLYHILPDFEAYQMAREVLDLCSMH